MPADSRTKVTFLHGKISMRRWPKKGLAKEQTAWDWPRSGVPPLPAPPPCFSQTRGPVLEQLYTRRSPWAATSTPHVTTSRNRHVRGKGWAQCPGAGKSLSRSPCCPWLAGKALILCAFLFPFPLEIGDKVLYFTLVKYTSTNTHIFKSTFSVSEECALLSSRETL